MRISVIYGVFLLLLGVLLVGVSQYLDLPNDLTSWRHIGLGVVQTIGVTLLGIGLLNIVLETADWRRYFEDRIREIVVEQSYIQKLDPNILQTMQVNILKALFRDKTIDREGSFLNYFHSNLHKYIAEPYREDVTTEIFCERHDDGRSWIVRDVVSYTCRRSAEAIQRDVRWEADHDEFRSVEAVSISIQYPYNHLEKGGEKSTLVEMKRGDIPEEGVLAPLSDYKEIDGLIVIVEVQVHSGCGTISILANGTPNQKF